MTVIESQTFPMLQADSKHSFKACLRDRFGNSLDTGGATVAARMQYVKQGMHDSNSLTAHNHTVCRRGHGPSLCVSVGHHHVYCRDGRCLWKI